MLALGAERAPLAASCAIAALKPSGSEAVAEACAATPPGAGGGAYLRGGAPPPDLL